MSNNSGPNGHNPATSWREIYSADLLQWFAENVWPDLGGWDRQRYNYMLNRFAEHFTRMPEAQALIEWIKGLPKARGSGRTAIATQLDYYERIKYMYKCAIEGYPPAKNLPPLTYESFRNIRWRNRESN